MVRHEVRGPRRRSAAVSSGEVNLSGVLDYLAPAFRESIHAAAGRYRQMNVRFALIGGIAASAYSQPRNTKDIDFLVGDEAFDTVGVIISPRAGLPVETILGVPIDSIPPHIEYRELYERALNEAVESDEPGIPIAPPDLVAVTKLEGGRLHDIAAVVEMLRAGTVDLDELERLVQPYQKLRDRCARARRELEGND